MNGDPTAPTAGEIVAFTTLQSRLFFPLGQLLNVQVEIQGSLALFDRIFEYLDLEPEIVDAPDAVVSTRRRSGATSAPRRLVPLPGSATAAGRAETDEGDEADDGDALDGAAASGRRADGRPEPTEDVEEAGTAVLEAGATADAAGFALDASDEWAARREALDAVGGGPAVDQPVGPVPGASPSTASTSRPQPGELVALVGPSGLGQDDDDLPHPAAVRRRRGRGRDRRPRRPQRSPSSRSGRSSGS